MDKQREHKNAEFFRRTHNDVVRNIPGFIQNMRIQPQKVSPVGREIEPAKQLEMKITKYENEMVYFKKIFPDFFVLQAFSMEKDPRSLKS